MNVPSSPLTEREKRIVQANSEIEGECPNPDCDLTVDVCDLTSDGVLYVSHEEDGVGLASRTDRGETDGCRVSPEFDPTL
jgi:hypothetical protein